MALKDRVAKIEGSALVTSQRGAASWWNALLSKPEENEHRINAAFYLALNDIIQKPSARVWEQLQARWTSDARAIPDSQLAFGVAYSSLENEAFDDRENQEWLCLIVQTYWDTFKGAPLPSMPEAEKDGKERPLVMGLGTLHLNYIEPIFARLFPDLPQRCYGHFEEWLEDAGVVESLLESAREWMNAPPAQQ